MSKQQYVTRYDNGFMMTQRIDSAYPVLFGSVAPQEKGRAQSQIEALQAQIVNFFADAGLNVSTTYTQYHQRHICIGISTSGPGFYTDQATAAVRQVRDQLQRSVGRTCSIGVEELRGTVWLETEG